MWYKDNLGFNLYVMLYLICLLYSCNFEEIKEIKILNRINIALNSSWLSNWESYIISTSLKIYKCWFLGIRELSYILNLLVIEKVVIRKSIELL